MTDQELVERCRAKGMGFVAMKGMAGGLISNGPAAAAWMARQEGVAPIWGVQHEWELDQFLSCVREAPQLTPEYQAVIGKDRSELAGDFCRGCGYCMPCPMGIEINQCARMSLMLRRAPATRPTCKKKRPAPRRRGAQTAPPAVRLSRGRFFRFRRVLTFRAEGHRIAVTEFQLGGGWGVSLF